jgi:hypothetical protein
MVKTNFSKKKKKKKKKSPKILVETVDGEGHPEIELAEKA